jgi:hypothetical protein
LKLDLHDEPDFDSYPSQDGAVAPPPQPKHTVPVSNRFATIADPDDKSDDAPNIPRTDPSTVTVPPLPPGNISHLIPPLMPKASNNQYWRYEAVLLSILQRAAAATMVRSPRNFSKSYPLSVSQSLSTQLHPPSL